MKRYKFYVAENKKQVSNLIGYSSIFGAWGALILLSYLDNSFMYPNKTSKKKKYYIYFANEDYTDIQRLT